VKRRLVDNAGADRWPRFAPVSRTATAPFDRLKVYLITAVDTPSELRKPIDLSKNDVATVAKQTLKFGQKGFQHLGVAVRKIYVDGGGIRAFWVGNGLNVTKIFPVSQAKVAVLSVD
jgi:solute carrier family 25 (mitochondrial phosphate transporter), member 23/24/25/41